MTIMQWLLLVTNLPGSNQTLRMRVWRALKASGAGALRDGVYVLPNLDSSRQLFAQQALDIEAGKGSAQLIAFNSEGPTQDAALRALFDRTGDYSVLNSALDAFKRKAIKLKEPVARREFSSLRRDYSAIEAIDFFPTAAREQVERTMADVDSLLESRFSPDEPRFVHGRIARCDRKDYRARTWATRERLWFDRVCSAWLIRRFIDPAAKFCWLKRIKDCPKRAVGFDFDGAQFTHVDGRVTFEVLVISFGLQGDEGLNRLARMVHYLDVGGLPVPEAAGFAAIMSGTRAGQLNDAALIAAIFPVLDHFYAGFVAPTG
jgi:hypothetical protein